MYFGNIFPIFNRTWLLHISFQKNFEKWIIKCNAFFSIKSYKLLGRTLSENGSIELENVDCLGSRFKCQLPKKYVLCLTEVVKSGLMNKEIWKKNPEKSRIRVKTGRFYMTIYIGLDERLRDLPSQTFHFADTFSLPRKSRFENSLYMD